MNILALLAVLFVLFCQTSGAGTELSLANNGDNYIEILPREKRQDLITGVLLPTAFKYAADHPDQVKGVFGKAKDSLSGLAKSGKHVVEKLANVTNKFKNTFKKWLGFGKSHASNEE
ncbi:hypothetical protein DdX_19653 [Ditylenchus destructor]|uniref:Uncharacterized protein n=1 Tax=Ditylenchus destructor TaxID=166010 RepID=A0AAD4QWY5_9BILA|nr:hypothetical protein DdX_19653 [Ditylenchus destructor]